MGILGSGGQRLRENLSFLVKKEPSSTSCISSRGGRVEGTDVSSSQELEVVKSNKEKGFWCSLTFQDLKDICILLEEG